MIVSPSILSADFADLGNQVSLLEKNGADFVHIDVMDGCFVPNITFGGCVIKAIRKYTSLPFDVHLMIDRPERYIEDFAAAGADIICFHIESTENVSEVLDKIKSLGKKCAIALKPGTSYEAVLPYLDELYMVLVMTVEPGFGGQKFMADQMSKIENIRRIADERGLDLRIEVDGGIDDKTVKAVKASGADVAVAGSYIFKNDFATAIESLKV